MQIGRPAFIWQLSSGFFYLWVNWIYSTRRVSWEFCIFISEHLGHQLFQENYVFLARILLLKFILFCLISFYHIFSRIWFASWVSVKTFWSRKCYNIYWTLPYKKHTLQIASHQQIFTEKSFRVKKDKLRTEMGYVTVYMQSTGYGIRHHSNLMWLG